MQVGNTDPAQSGYWSVRESFVCFVLTNMPMIYPLIKTFIEKSVSSASGSYPTGMQGSSGYPLGSRSANNRSGRGGGAGVSKSGDNTTTMGLSNEANWGSKEHIVADNHIDKDMSSGDDASLLDSDKAPRHINHQSPPQCEATASANRAMSPTDSHNLKKSRRGSWRPDQIVVTTEYTVIMDGESGNGHSSRV